MLPHQLPRQEDVTEISDLISVVTVTDDNRDALVEVALSMYLGEGCKYCHRVFETLEDLAAAVWAGYHERGRLAHKECWEKNNVPD